MKQISTEQCNHYQESIYFHWKQNPSSDAYHLPFIYEVNGMLNVNEFIKGSQQIFKSHYAFGLKFNENSNGNVEAVYSELCIPQIRFASFAANDKADLKKEFDAYKEEFLWRTFNLNEGETCFIDLVSTTSANKYFIFINAHHIISDAYSFYEIVTRLSEYYNSGNMQVEGNLSTSTAKFRAFNSYISNVDVPANVFVKKNFSQAQTMDNFQLDYDKKEKTVIERLLINADRKRLIEKFCQDKNISPFVFYLGCYRIFLYKVLDSDNLLTGIPIANRPGKEYKDVVGYFVNTLPLVVTLNKDTVLDKLFNDLKANTFNLIKYKNANIKHVLKGKENATIASSSVYDNIFTYYKQKLTLTLSGCEVIPIPVHRTSLHCPFTIIVEDGTEDTHIDFVKDNRIFSELDIESNFNTIVDAVLKPEMKIVSDISLVSDEDWENLVKKTNITQGMALGNQSNDTIFDRFKKIALETPGHAACTFADHTLTYGQLLEKAETYGQLIVQKLKGNEDNKVALLIPIGLEQIIGIFSVLEAGKTYIPIDPAIPQQRIQYILDDTAASIILTTPEISNKLKLAKDRCIFLDAFEKLPAGEAGIVTRNREDMAYIIYTSGTTGNPKGVMVPQKNVMSLIDETMPLFKFNNRDKWSLLHSYAFDFSVWEIFGALLHGGTLVIAPDHVRKSHHAFWEFIGKQKITILNQTPSYFQQLIKEATSYPQAVALRKVIFGGEKLIFNSLKNWIKHYPLEEVNLINMYGITETTVHVTYHNITQDDINLGRSLIGKAIPTWDVCILGSDERPMPVGTTGEICVAGNGVSMGYLNKKELTRERFILLNMPGKGLSTLYKSGDLGRINKDGTLEYFGRRDKQVKIRGFRIELKEIEKTMQEHPLCDIAAVKVIEHDDNDKSLAGYYLSFNSSIPSHDMRRLLKEKLPQYMIPTYLFSLDEFPLTVNGKIDYHALPLPGKNTHASEIQVLDTDSLEVAMIKITRDILKTNDVNIEDNFFDLGGNSLLMIEFLNRVNQLLENRKVDTQLQVLDLYQYSTIKDLLQSIERQIPEFLENEAYSKSPEDSYNNRLSLLAQISK